MDDKEYLKEVDKNVEAAFLSLAIEKFNKDRAAKSFSGRHPELGKMVNCFVCDKRHRSAHACLPRYCDINVLHAKRKAKKEKQK